MFSFSTENISKSNILKELYSRGIKQKCGFFSRDTLTFDKYKCIIKYLNRKYINYWAMFDHTIYRLLNAHAVAKAVNITF